MMIRKATIADAAAAARLAVQMWDSHAQEELAAEFAELLTREDAAMFLSMDGETAVGFAQCQLRRDYVEGTESSPVGYLEGIFVDKAYRKAGCARKLLEVCQNWAKEQGCREFASDCELTNEQSLQFHLSCGFTESNRIICFTKKL